MPEAEDFGRIPDPKKLDPDSPIDAQMLVQGALEGKQLINAWSPPWRERYDWFMRYVLRTALFAFVVGLNWWWDVNVSRLVWRSGTAATGFHLSDTILIALVTTSMTNFLALVIIIAKHLFPEIKP